MNPIAMRIKLRITPGPWHEGQGNGEGDVFAAEGRMQLQQGGTTLTSICTVHDFNGSRPYDLKAIAAVPELLAALMRLVDQAELTDDFAESEHSTLRSAVRQAWEAIKKAT